MSYAVMLRSYDGQGSRYPSAEPSTQAQSQAQVLLKLGPRVTADQGDIADAPGRSLAIGIDGRVRLEDFPIQVDGSIDYYPKDEVLSIYTFDINLVYLFVSEDRSLTPYAGLGLSAARITSDADVGEGPFDASSTETGANIVGGIEYHLGRVMPFVQAQFTNGEDLDRFGVSGGLLVVF